MGKRPQPRLRIDALTGEWRKGEAGEGRGSEPCEPRRLRHQAEGASWRAPSLGPGGENIIWPDQVAPRGRKASSTRKMKPQTSNLRPFLFAVPPFLFLLRPCCLWRSVFSGLGCLGPWRLLVSPFLPPPAVFFLAFPRSFFSSSPRFFFLRPRCLWRSVCSGPGCLGPWRIVVAPAPPPVVCSFLFVFCFLFVFFPRLCLAGGALRGWRVCPGLRGVLVCASVLLSLSLLFVRCSLAPVALAGVVWCCPSCLGVCCWAWLSSVAFWWVLVWCFGGAVPVWPPGSPPCGLVWCVLVFRCPVLCCVALCCRVVVCYRALLSVCVVACACCLFPAAGRLLCVFWGPVLCVPCPLRPVRCCAALC